MSCIKKIKTFNVVKEIKIKFANKEEIEKLIRNIKDVVIQKFNKLNLIIKNMNIKFNDYSIIVKDEYGICPQLKNIVESFNCKIAKLDDGSYLITDDLILLLKDLNEFIDFKSIFTNALKENNQYINFKATNSVCEIIKNIRSNGTYNIKLCQKVKHIYYDDYEEYIEKKGKYSSNQSEILNKIKNYLEQLNKKIVKSNNDI